jgi:hypothetical protein
MTGVQPSLAACFDVFAEADDKVGSPPDVS